MTKAVTNTMTNNAMSDSVCLGFVIPLAMFFTTYVLCFFLPENHLSWKRFPVKLIKSCGPVAAVAERGGEGGYLRDQGVNLPSPLLSLASRWGSIMLLSQSVAGTDTHV